MWTGRFWKAAAERSLKTAAQVLVTFAGADALNVFGVDWQRAAGLALGAAVVSVLTSIVSAPVGPVAGSPSLVGE